MSDVRPTSMPPPAPVEFRYTQTDSFPAVLRELGASLVITTYQANKLLVARAMGEGLSMLVRTFDRPMGLAVHGDRLALGTRDQVWHFRNAGTSPLASNRPADTTPASCLERRT